MAKRTKVPRASLACTIVDDVEYMALMMDKHGREGFALFCAMLCAAKSQSNEGVFDQQPSVIAAMIRWPLAAYQNALAVLLRKTNWLEVDYSNALTIRSYAKWNAWGGNREGAGRKSSGNQDGTKARSKGVTPASVTGSGTKDLTTVVELPSDLEPHRESVEDWLAYKREKGQTYKPRGLKTLFGSMVELGAGLPAAVKHSMANNYAGLFPPSGKATVKPSDKVSEEYRR